MLLDAHKGAEEVREPTARAMADSPVAAAIERKGSRQNVARILKCIRSVGCRCALSSSTMPLRQQ